MAFQGLAGKVAIVTGGAGALGRAVVERLLAEGCSVAAVDRDGAALAGLGGGLDPARLAAIEADLAEDRGAAACIDQAAARFGRVDLLANAVGILGRSGRIVDLDVEDFDAVYRVNVRAVFLTMKYALRRMLEQGDGGAIVNFASVAALKGRADRSLYGASKRAVVALTASAAAEYGANGIRVNAVAPGAIESPMFRTLAGTAGAGPWGSGGRPIARTGLPEEVAAMVAFLLSDEASYCTGAVHTVDGGLMA